MGRAFTKSIEHSITDTEFPISNRLYFIIGHSLFVIGYSTTQNSGTLSRRASNTQYRARNFQYPTAFPSSLDIPCSLLDIQLLKNGSRFHEERRTPNIEHGISNIQPPFLHHWTFPVRHWIFTSLDSRPFEFPNTRVAEDAGLIESGSERGVGFPRRFLAVVSLA